MKSTYIFIFKLFGQGLNLEPLSLIIIEGVFWIVGRGHTSRFISLLQQTVVIHQYAPVENRTLLEHNQPQSILCLGTRMPYQPAEKKESR